MYIIARVARDCHAPQLTRVFKLTVATFGRYQIPAIFFQELEYLTYLHTDAHHTLRCTESGSHLTIEYTDQHGAQIPHANSRAVLVLVHRLVTFIHNAALACYPDRNNAVIDAKDSILGSAQSAGLCTPLPPRSEDVCIDDGRPSVCPNSSCTVRMP